MLGRDETGSSTVAAAASVGSTDRLKTTPTTTVRPTPISWPSSATPPRTTVVATAPWPSGKWIMEMAEQIRAAAVARGVGAGGAAGADPYDYDDGGDSDDDDGDDGEIEEIDSGVGVGGGVGGGDGDNGEPTIVVAEPPSPQQHPPRPVAGHMSRYQFKRIDGQPDDGRINGTYVAVVESGRPPRVVVYDPVSVKWALISIGKNM